MINFVRQVRESLNVELDELARQVGLSSQFLFALEENACCVGLEPALRIARALGTTVERIFVDEESQKTVDSNLAVDCAEELPARSDDEFSQDSPGLIVAPVQSVGSSTLEFDSDAVISKSASLEPHSSPLKKKRSTSVKNSAVCKSRKVGEKRVPSEEGSVKGGRSRTNARAVDTDESTKIAPYSTLLTNKSLDELFPVKDSSSNSLFGASEVEGVVQRVFAPRHSQKSSSARSKTAQDEGLAETPDGLLDATVARSIRYFDLFCGIGGFRFAAERTFAAMSRASECALSCDIDLYAQKSYAANFGETPYGDVSCLPSDEIPDFDLLFAGFPCQTFSIIGLRKGFADETKGSLFFQIARILKDKRPRAFVLENVRQLTTHDNGRTFEIILRVLQEELGYYVDWRVLNALDCGLPQKRERVVIVGSTEPFEMEWPRVKSERKSLSEILEEDKDVDRKYFASPEIIAKRKSAHTSEYFPAIWHENKSGNISSYPYSCALRAGASYNYLLVNGERRLTPREMLRLQGFPDEFKIVVSDAQIRKQAGNAAPVDLIQVALERFLPLVFTKK